MSAWRLFPPAPFGRSSERPEEEEEEEENLKALNASDSHHLIVLDVHIVVQLSFWSSCRALVQSCAAVACSFGALLVTAMQLMHPVAAMILPAVAMAAQARFV